MDISGISSPNNIRTSLNDLQQQEVQRNQFQTILEHAINIRDFGLGNEAAERAQIREAAELFESYFIQMMFREMRRSGFDDSGFIEKSHAERIFTDMLDEEVANQAASGVGNGFGLADMIYAQMTRHLDPNIIIV